MYNETFINTTNVADYTTEINIASGGLMAILILVLIWIITFIAMKHFDTKVVFLSSSFLTSIIGVFFLALEWITFGVLIVPLILTMFSVVIILFSKE